MTRTTDMSRIAKMDADTKRHLIRDMLTVLGVDLDLVERISQRKSTALPREAPTVTAPARACGRTR